MRNTFAKTIHVCAQQDSNVVLLSGDIGNRLFDSLKADCPDQFINCGVAESNMVSMAAGMAMAGMRPVVYTIATFLIYRPFEHIRVDLGYHHLPVVLVGVGGGLCYAQNGPTHHALEDIAVMRTIPGMQVVCPGDCHEVDAALKAALRSQSPTYIRLGKKGELDVHSSSLDSFQIGNADLIRTGSDIALLATGNMLYDTMAIAEELSKVGINAAVYSYHTVKPLDESVLRHCFESYPLVCTLEEHSCIGGLGSAVAEWACDHQMTSKSQLKRLALPDAFVHETGEQPHVREISGLSVRALTVEVLETLQMLTLNTVI